MWCGMPRSWIQQRPRVEAVYETIPLFAAGYIVRRDTDRQIGGEAERGERDNGIPNELRNSREEPVTDLADAVLPLIRTRADLHRWSTANEHGRRMHEGIDELESALPTADPAEMYAVTHKALASAITVIARADDSSGIIGDACRRLLALHPAVAAAANAPTAKLIDWMIKFQFDGEVDYFELDPVAYAPALGEEGMKRYRQRLTEIEAGLGPRPDEQERWRGGHSHDWFTLDWNAKRLAVLDHDVEAIIATHARDRRVAAWLHDTAKAFVEIGEIDLAIDWAWQATDFDRGHQSQRAADYWCTLLEAHRPEQAAAARRLVFKRWPSSSTATALYRTAGSAWPELREDVITTLTANPREAVLFILLTLREASVAWNLAHAVDLDDDIAWAELVKAYEKIDPLAVIPILQRLTLHDLVEAKAQNYRSAARRLARMRRLAAGTEQAADVDAFIAELREDHRRRPRLQQEFDRAGLP